MKKKQKRDRSSDDDSDSDAERNFALFTEKQPTGAKEEIEEEEEEREEQGEESEEKDAESNQEEEESEEEESDEAEDDEGDDKLRTSEDVQKELSHMSFEDVLKLQNKVGTKVYNKVKHGEMEKKEKCKRRLNKNRPMEVSAKRPVPFLRQIVAVKKSTLRDPRFDDLSGEYKSEIFEKTYSFINDIKNREKEVVKKKLKKTKSEKKKEKLQFLVKRMENQERARLSREQQRDRELQFKRAQRERANQGQAPLFLKNSEKKKLQLLEKYEGLKKSGKLDQFMTKKRKRNAVKDRRKLPPQQHSNAPRGLH